MLALHNRNVCPCLHLVQVDVEVCWEKVNRALLKCPLLIDDWAFTTAQIVFNAYLAIDGLLQTLRLRTSILILP